VTDESGDVIADLLPIQLARRHERQFQLRMASDQFDQFGAGVAARTDDADGFPAHGVASYRASLASRSSFTPGHSLSMMEKTTVSRGLPSAWRLWLRRMPSCFAPRRAIAARERSLRELVSN